jgi:three-Cys-motif partner protein
VTKHGDKYAWAVGSSPPPIDAHSLVKHDIVRNYLERYVQVLMSNVLIERLTLTIVDGFAGGGEYTDLENGGTRDGSPFIAMQAIREQEARLNIGRLKPRCVDARYFFVEKNRSNFEYLRLMIGAREDPVRMGRDIFVLEGDFQQRVDAIIGDIVARGNGQRALFLLDQYAYDQVSGPLLRKIFSQVKGAEVLLTFNVESLITFISDSGTSRRKLAEMGLEQYIDWPAVPPVPI